MNNYAVMPYVVCAVRQHPNADRLAIATVEGFECVVRLGEWVVGDVAYYIPRDVVLPPDLARSLGLKLARVKVIKLRGTRSEGILMSPAFVTQYAVDHQLDIDVTDSIARALDLGCDDDGDIAEALGIKKYIHPTMRKRGVPNKEKVKMEERTDIWMPPPHQLMRSYDIPNAKKVYSKLRELAEQNVTVIATEKIHGTFCALYVDRDPHVAPVVSSKGLSSNGAALFDDGNLYHEALDRLNIIKKLTVFVRGMMPDSSEVDELLGVILLGEIYGRGIQDLSYGCQFTKYRAFDVAVVARKPDGSIYQQFMDHATFICFTLQTGLPRVPVVYTGPMDIGHIEAISEDRSIVPVDDAACGFSTMDNFGHIREGVVVKRADGEDLCDGVRKVKFISDQYLLRQRATEGQ